MLCPMQIGMLCSRTLFLSLDETGALPTGLFQLEGNPCICSVYTNLQNANFAEILVDLQWTIPQAIKTIC